MPVAHRRGVVHDLPRLIPLYHPSLKQVLTAIIRSTPAHHSTRPSLGFWIQFGSNLDELDMSR